MAVSIDPEEVENFETVADEWWNPNGPFAPLHQMNPCRIAYIRDHVATYFGRDPLSAKPLEGLTILDVGCGGGLLCEPLSRLGAEVTGLDASPTAIKVAREHSMDMEIKVSYQQSTAEEMAASGRRFDVVLNLEIIEHVNDPKDFTKSCCELVTGGGCMIVSTMNRTTKSFLQAILAAEYVLRWVPRGTHDWKKFLEPAEIQGFLQENGLAFQNLQGMKYKPLRKNWELSPNLSVNYIGFATRKAA